MKQLNEAAIVGGYNDGMSLRELAEAYGVSTKPIRRVLAKHGIVMRAGRGADRTERKARRSARSAEAFTDEERSEIKRRFIAGDTQIALAADFHSSPTTIGRVLRLAGVPAGAHGQVREHHHAWKGGKTAHHEGYVLVRPEADDELGQAMKGQNGYVLEHRLVMARYLERPLEEWETVHHINTDHEDNLIENLQLRIGRHGKGAVYECEDCGSRRLRPVALAT